MTKLLHLFGGSGSSSSSLLEEEEEHEEEGEREENPPPTRCLKKGRGGGNNLLFFPFSLPAAERRRAWRKSQRKGQLGGGQRPPATAKKSSTTTKIASFIPLLRTRTSKKSTTKRTATSTSAMGEMDGSFNRRITSASFSSRMATLNRDDDSSYTNKTSRREKPTMGGPLNQFMVVEVQGCANSLLRGAKFEHHTQCPCCPIARSGHRIWADANFVYVVGGYNPAHSPNATYTDVWRFNLLTERWQPCPVVKGAVPPTLASFSLVSGDGETEALIYGGTGVPFGTRTSNQLHRLFVDRRGNCSVLLHNPPAPDRGGQGDDGGQQEGQQAPPQQGVAGLLGARRRHRQLQQQQGGADAGWPKIYGQAMVHTRALDPKDRRMKEQVYLVGGTSGHIYNLDVWRLERPLRDRNSSAWTCKRLNEPSSEAGRYRLEVVLHEGRLISFGGGAPDFIAEFRELPAFELRTGDWTRLKARPDPVHGFPLGRKCHSIVEWRGGVFLVGGSRDTVQLPPQHNHPGAGQRFFEIFSDLWRFDLVSGQWRRLPAKLQSPVFFHSAAVTPSGCLYVFGGCTDSASSSRSNRLQRVWLSPPSLVQLAGSALVQQDVGPALRHALLHQGTTTTSEGGKKAQTMEDGMEEAAATAGSSSSNGSGEDGEQEASKKPRRDPTEEDREGEAEEPGEQPPPLVLSEPAAVLRAVLRGLQQQAAA